MSDTSGTAEARDPKANRPPGAPGPSMSDYEHVWREAEKIVADLHGKLEKDLTDEVLGNMRNAFDPLDEAEVTYPHSGTPFVP